MPQKSPRRKRRDLTLEEIVSLASDLLRDVPDSELTMRALADACGVTPMALYNHVADKEELLTHVVDRVLAPLVTFDASGYDDPRDALVEYGALMRSLLLAHRGAATTYLRRPILSPTLTRLTERFFELVTALDMADATTPHLVDAVVLLTMGSVVNDLTRPPEIRHRLGETGAEPEAPIMQAHIQAYANRDGAQRYRETVRWMLEGVT